MSWKSQNIAVVILEFRFEERRFWSQPTKPSMFRPASLPETTGLSFEESK
jgi:hypothetical protein